MRYNFYQHKQKNIAHDFENRIKSSTDGSGHESVAVLLSGFASK